MSDHDAPPIPDDAAPVAAPPEAPAASTASEPHAGTAEPAHEAPADTAIEPTADAASATTAVAEAVAANPKVPDLSPAACGARLAELFPALFATDAPPRPLKLRIQADIQQRAPGVFTRKSLGLFFSRHTTTTAYLKALVAAPHRFDLDGQPAGEIAAEHKTAAEAEVARRRAIVEARRQAERQAAREAARQGPRPAARRPDPSAGADAPTADAPTADRPPRPPRPPRPDRPRRPDGPPGATADARREPREERHRDGRDGHAGARQDPRRTPRQGPRPDNRGPRPDAGSPGRPHAEPAAARPDDPARRERAFILRAFETSSLTKANFCALKRLTEAELDALLDQARQERAERGPRGPQRPA